MARASEAKPQVILIDDDRSVREALHGLFRSVGLSVASYESVQAYLEAAPADQLGCMVLDVRLPGKSGLEFQEDLAAGAAGLPIVFISGHADVEMSVRAMKAGAVEFLTKPVREQALLDAVQTAIERDRERRKADHRHADLRRDYDSLTRREREILALIASGLRNREIAAELGLAEATVKLHRGHVMQKMQAQSVVDLVRMFDALTKTGLEGSTKV